MSQSTLKIVVITIQLYKLNLVFLLKEENGNNKQK